MTPNGIAKQNTSALLRLLDRWAREDGLREARENRQIASGREAVVARARAYVAKEPPAVSGQNGHGRTFHVACQLVKGFGLTEDEGLAVMVEWNQTCQPPWSEKELRHKLKDAAKQPGEAGFLLGEQREPSSNGTHRPNAENSQDPLDQDATADDLIAANATIGWAWEKWIPVRVLTILASDPGVGKTRFCADLARRMYHALPWPDGSPPSFPAGSKTLWVPADNQHAELGTIPTDFGFSPSSIYLNATRRNPFAGTMLDGPEDLHEFECRIRRIQPAMVFIDTSLNATDRTSHKPEDAKAFFVPLQQIAARTGIAIVCVTHLNAGGKPLGRRIMGQGRLVMQLEQPDPEGQINRRKLWVVKSNSLMPPALGVTMGAEGNTYDLDPPKKPEDANRKPRGKEAKAWLLDALKSGPKRVSHIRTEAELHGFSPNTLYSVKEFVGIEEYSTQGKKWWRLSDDSYIEKDVV